MLTDELKQNKLIDIFYELVKIPSPSCCENKVIEWITNFCAQNKIHCETDSYSNIYIKIPATNPNKTPILLSSHMDVVGDFSMVNVMSEGNFIQTDGKRTLGADDKAGVACALYLAYALSNDSEINHGGLEIVFTRDEEQGMSGIKNVDFSKIESSYVLVLDADKLGQLLVSGASYTNAYLKVTTNYGGHSGLDIHDSNRLNAAKLIAEIICNIPQGVFYADETGTITSINLGTVIGGNIQNTVCKVCDEQVKSENYLDYFIENSITNVINTQAQASYSIRSASVEKENELKQLITDTVEGFNEKYKGLASAALKFSVHLPPFEKADDNLIVQLHTNVCNELGIKQCISSFHAGAETHIYAQNTNTNGNKFVPFLVGLADIFNMHSCEEKIDYQSYLKGYELLKQLFIEINNSL